MSSRAELIVECRRALDDISPVDYDFSDEDIAAFINRTLKVIYPGLYRLVANQEIRLRYGLLTYDLSTLHPPVEGLIAVYIIGPQGDYYIRRHYDYNAASMLLTFDASFYWSLVGSTWSTSDTGVRLFPVYRSYFTPLVDDDQECELAPPDEELLLLGTEEYALRRLRQRMLKGRKALATETWNELERVIQSTAKHLRDTLARKTMVRHGGYPSTRRRRMTAQRVRSF